MLRSCLLKGCLVPMVISFSDSVSSPTQFSGVPARPDSASSVKSQAHRLEKECDVCPEPKSEQLTDDDFGSMLASMIGGIVLPEQLPIVAETTEKASIGTAWPEGSASSPTSTTSQDAVKDTNAVSSRISVEIDRPESSANNGVTAGMQVDQGAPQGRSLTLNDIGSRSRPVPAPVGSQPTATDGFELLPTERSSFQLPVSNDTGNPELQAKAHNFPPTPDSDLSALPEALPQAAIDALDRIGRSPGSEISPSVVTAEQVSSASIATTLETVRGDGQKLGLAVRSEPALTSKTAAIVPVPGFPLAEGGSELVVNSAGAGSSPPKALPIRDDSAIPPRVASDATVAAASDVIRGDMSQGNIAPALTELSTSIASELQQPLSSQVSQAIMAQIERNGVRSNDTLSVRLDPPELGELTIQLSRTDEGLAVRVTAREAVTMDMLFARGQEIESHLRGRQLNLKSLEFLHDMSGNGFSHGQRQSETSQRAESLLSSVRRSSHVSSQADSGRAKRTTPESSHSLSFRA